MHRRWQAILAALAAMACTVPNQIFTATMPARSPLSAGRTAKEMLLEYGQFRLLDQGEVVALQIVIGNMGAALCGGLLPCTSHWWYL